MRKKSSLTIALLLLLFFAGQIKVYADIVECSHFSEIIPYIEAGDHVFFEIDNVIIKPTVEVASVAYFDYLKQKSLNEQNDPEQIVEELYPLWVAIQKKAPYELVDPIIPNYFKSFASLGAQTFGLTNRGVDLAYKTLDLLDDFNVNFPSNEDILILEKNRALFLEGVLFLHPGCDKGEYLSRLIKDKNLLLKRIVCVDYNLMQLVNMQKMAEELQLPFLGIYIRHHELNISNYTIQIGDIQREYFNKILSDSIAKLIIQEV